MIFLENPKIRITSQSFSKGCRWIVILWLLGVYLPLNLNWEDQTRFGTSRRWTFCFPNGDFSQYYLAGVAARHDLWDHLYPRFKSEWVNRPGRKIWSSECVETDPLLLAKAPGLPQIRVENIAPPPQAILCLPLAYLSFPTAFKLWMTGLILATLGVVIMGVKIYRRLGGTSGFFEGGFYLCGIFLPLLPRIGAGDNAMMFLVFCIGIAALNWVTERPFALSVGLIIPGVFKGLTFSWCPLLILPPIKRRTLFWMACWTLLLNGLVLFWGGPTPYRNWLNDILPVLQSMDIQQCWHPCMNLKGIAFKWGWISFPAGLMKCLYLVGLAAVYWGYWKRRNASGRAALANLCAALSAVLVLFNLGNEVSWLPYISFLLPFAGWAYLEYQQASAYQKKLIHILTGVFFLVVPAAHWWFTRFVLKNPEASTNAGRDFYVGVELMFLILAYRRLFSKSDHIEKPNTIVTSPFQK